MSISRQSAHLMYMGSMAHEMEGPTWFDRLGPTLLTPLRAMVVLLLLLNVM